MALGLRFPSGAARTSCAWPRAQPSAGELAIPLGRFLPRQTEAGCAVCLVILRVDFHSGDEKHTRSWSHGMHEGAADRTLGRLAAAAEDAGEAALGAGAGGVRSAGPWAAGRVLVQSQPSLSLQRLVCVDGGQALPVL